MDITPIDPDESEALAGRRHKQLVALTSVLAAVVLTAMKLAAGLLTGSLGLIAEAAHSGLDLVAALLTLFAVRLADRPPDLDHPYGHGKIENLSAFFEAGLLLLTAVWIVYEATQRLLFYHVEVEPSLWAFLVIGLSVAIDYSRSRALAHAARKYGSQALEADALHFGTDIWSSAVVLLGLSAIGLGRLTGLAGPWERADAVAAILVALVVIWVGSRLARETIDALLDRAPEELPHRIAEAAAGVSGVLECRRVRVRRAGNKYFADLIVAVPRTATFARTHDIGDEIEEAVRQVAPRADVVVHLEPVASARETAADQIHYVARQLGLRAHNVRVHEVEGQLEADLHIEVDPRLPLRRAHSVADRLERAVEAANPSIRAVHTHLEGLGRKVEPRQEVTADRADLVRDVTAVADRFVGTGACHEVRVYQEADDPAAPPDLVLHCTFPEGLKIEQVHERSAEIERALRAELGNLGRILVHAEPHG